VSRADRSPRYLVTAGKLRCRTVVIVSRHAGSALVEDVETRAQATVRARDLEPWGPRHQGHRLAAFYRANILEAVNHLAARLEQTAAELRALGRDRSLGPDAIAERAQGALARLDTTLVRAAQLSGDAVAWTATTRALARLPRGESDRS
jgi:hypothetical protein